MLQSKSIVKAIPKRKSEKKINLDKEMKLVSNALCLEPTT